MKCKLLFSESPHIESVINQWLDDNPNILIDHVCYGAENDHQHDTVLIFYRQLQS